MKHKFNLPNDEFYHEYCMNCYLEGLQKQSANDKTFYSCPHCKTILPRRIVIDPDKNWWIDKETNEIWHESVGVFIFNSKNEALFFNRTNFPFGYTIPAGHKRKNESPIKAAFLEVMEETDLYLKEINLFCNENVAGDECRYGANNHYWNLFTAKMPPDQEVNIKYEGKEYKWMNLDEVLKSNIITPVRYFIEKYGDKLYS